MSEGMQQVSNYLVPSTSSPNAYVVREAFSATPKYVNFNNVQLDGVPFRPSGVLIDNSAGLDTLTVLINEMSFTVNCPAGETLQAQYPAPLNHTANITGDGTATVVFVDYPVIPFAPSSGGGGNIPNPLPVTGPITDAELRASAIDVNVVSGGGGGGATSKLRFTGLMSSNSTNVVPLSKLAGQKVIITDILMSVSPTSYLDVAGEFNVAVSDNVTTDSIIFNRVYLSDTAPTYSEPKAGVVVAQISDINFQLSEFSPTEVQLGITLGAEFAGGFLSYNVGYLII